MELFKVQRTARQPLLDFMVAGLEEAGCHVLYVSPAKEAPFRITFARPSGERIGVIAYAFLANSKVTTNRPLDEHRFQLKYGSKDGNLHDLWQDPGGLYTTLLVGIDPERGIFVGADPVLHSPTRFFISVEFKRAHADQIQRTGWHVWERERRSDSHEAPIEVLVGGTRQNFLRYVLLEREALGEDQGHRQLLGEQFGTGGELTPTLAGQMSKDKLHTLAAEFALSEGEILDLIGGASRLKMAVRGWVAEEHLARSLRSLPGVQAVRVEGQGEIDVSVTLPSGLTFGVQCKNVLRQPTASGLARLDFQRTRVSLGDPCSRYYLPTDFPVVAACMHAVTSKWEFRFVSTRALDPHPKCGGRLASNVRIDSRWLNDPLEVFRQLQ